MPYQGTGEEVRKGDTVRLSPPYDRRYGDIGKLDGVIVCMARDGTWVDVRYYTGPGSIFPEIDHTTRRIPTERLRLVHRAEGE